MVNEEKPTCQEDKNVSGRFGEMNLHDGDERGVKIIRFRFASVEDFYGKRPSGNGENGRLCKGDVEV